MNQPTSTRKVKPQPPQHPNLFQTQQEWDAHHEAESTNVWHHLPLALVALPPLLSIIHGRAENWSDAILLLLVAFYLYQLVKVPWEMYYASHTRVVLPSSLSSTSEDPSTTLERSHSTSILRRNELLSLLATALVPFTGSYLLHYIRGLLSDPDRYINSTLINLFAIATTVKPFLHLVELLKNHSLYHQSLVHYPSTEVHILTQRITKLESDLLQLSRAFATKSDIRALRDGVDVPLSQLSKQFKRFSRLEEYSRLTSEEKFSLISSRLDESFEVSREQQMKLEELERERRKGRGGENEFMNLVGRMLGLVFVPNSNYKRSEGQGKKKKEVGWYERGILGVVLWPAVGLPKKAVGWAVEKAEGGLRGLEKGWEEEKELKLSASAGGGAGGIKGGGTAKRRNHVLKG